MGDQQALEEEAIVARIREQLRAVLKHAPLTPPPPRGQPPADTSAEAIEGELEAMRGAADVRDVQPRSYGRMLAPFVRLARGLARKLLAPSLERQVSYNLANHRLVAALQVELASLEKKQQALGRRGDALEAELASIRSALRTQ